MKFATLVLAILGLAFGSALAAPPATPMPGTPSGLVPIKHPPYTAICATGFTPNPTSYDSSDPNASFVCSDHLNSDGCSVNAGFGIWHNGEPGFSGMSGNKFFYQCFKYENPAVRMTVPNCGTMAGFTAGTFDATKSLHYDCLSAPLTCSGGLVTDSNGFKLNYDNGGYFQYRCKRPS